jgi:N-acetylmuramoyl-L-alanine amidase
MRMDTARIFTAVLIIGLLLLFPKINNQIRAESSDAAEKHKTLKIVIDPGHGGKDPGALGPCGDKEKDITLAVSKVLAKRLSEKGFEVFLTRESDVFIPLGERTAFANKRKADLFICVHVNASDKLILHGVETYFLNLTADASSMRVAKRENSMTSESLGSLQLIIKDLMLNARINESSRFASSIQKSIISSLCKSGHEARDNGVKQAPFYVLVGAQMPSILIEMGFITNASESKLLQSEEYQNYIIDGILMGVDKFITNTNFAYNSKNKDHD